MRNLWLRVNYDTGEVVADGLIKLQGTFFSAILCPSPLLASNRNLTIEKGVAADDTIIRLKVCKRNVWVDIRQQPNILNDPDSSQFIGSIYKSDVFRLGIAAFSEAEMKAAGVTITSPQRAMHCPCWLMNGYIFLIAGAGG
jgi:hypothetical protein